MRLLKRPVAVLGVAALLSLLASGISFGWATINWQPRQDVMSDLEGFEQPNEIGSFLSLYTSDPSANVSVDLEVHSGTRQGYLLISINDINDLAGDFEWALIGFNENTFTPMFRDASGKPEAQQTRIQPKRHCGSDTLLSDPIGASVIRGGLMTAKFIGSNSNVADFGQVGMGRFRARLEFPRLAIKALPEAYEVQMPNIGARSSVPYLLDPGSMVGTPTCIDFGQSTDFGLEELALHQAPFSVALSPKQPNDIAEMTDPPTSHLSDAAWKIVDGTNLVVKYRDSQLVSVHQLAIFVAGIFGGLGASFAVSGVVESLALIGPTKRESGLNGEEAE